MMNIDLFLHILFLITSFSSISTFKSLKIFARSIFRPSESPILSIHQSIEEVQLPAGFERQVHKSKKPETPIPISNIKELKSAIKLGYRVRDVDVRGNTSLSSSSYNHPVIRALYQRKTHPNTTDNHKIALVIEGGGMRGVVAAGMATAVWYLGLADAVDVVYGSSAGSLVGAYFIARQLPYYGPEVYYKYLPLAGESFIDFRAILRSIGLGLLDLRPQSIVDFFNERIGKPVLNLNYLLETIVQELQPLDWEVFWSKQVTKQQVLKVVASGLLSKKSIIMSAENGNFETLPELTNCMRASMLLPGLTGDAARLKGRQVSGLNNIAWPEYYDRRRSNLVNGSEPMSDAFIFEPIPYRSAVKDNCTHILVLRTRADNLTVTAKMGLVEKLIMKRYFGRKLKLPHVMHWMINQYHKLVYAEDMLILNEANRRFDEPTAAAMANDDVSLALKQSSVYTVALPSGKQSTLPIHSFN
jgi:predicted patatin/cPLA2 family phospholipase